MKRRGRPPIAPDDPSVNVQFRLPTKAYDLTQRRADLAQMSLSEWLRRVVTRAARERPPR